MQRHHGPRRSETIHFPIGRNIHKGGILDLCIVPAGTELEPEIVDACEKFMEGCDYRGILAIELFIKGNDFVFNEMAPRPHNSGHYTIEGCTSSQYTELCHSCSESIGTAGTGGADGDENILGQDLAATWKSLTRLMRSIGRILRRFL